MLKLTFTGPLARVGLFFGISFLLQGCSLMAHKPGGTWTIHAPLSAEERARLPDAEIKKRHKIVFSQSYPDFQFWKEDKADIGGVPVDPWSLEGYLGGSGRPDLKKKFGQGTALRWAAELGMGSGLIFLASGQSAKEPVLRGGLSAIGIGAILGALPFDVWGALKRGKAVDSFNDWLSAVPPADAGQALLPEIQPQVLPQIPPPKNKDELFYRTFRMDLEPFRIGGVPYREELVAPYLDRVGRPELKEPIEQARGLGGVATCFGVIGLLGTLWSCNEALAQNGVPVASQDWQVIQPVFWCSLGSLGTGVGLQAITKSWVKNIEADYNNGLKAKFKLKF
jgi:hypothetical protein